MGKEVICSFAHEMLEHFLEMVEEVCSDGILCRRTVCKWQVGSHRMTM